MEETKTCNTCGEIKPISDFHRLRKDRDWRRSDCKICHTRKTRENRAIRLSRVLLIIFLSLWSNAVVAQSIHKQRELILDSINYYREDPMRAEQAYGIALRGYMPNHPYVMDAKLTRRAQAWSDRMAKTNKYVHSNLRYANAESVDCITDWQGGYADVVHRLIIDKGVASKGHRKHMLRHDDTLIGIGISRSEGATYVCIKTK